MGHGHEIHINQEQYQFNGKIKTASLGLLIIGLILTVVGIFTLPKEEHATSHGNAHATEAAATQSHHGDASHDAPAQPEVHTADFNINGVDVAHSDEQLYPIHPEHAKPASTRIWVDLLINGYFLLLIGVCALFFFALQFIANAGWATAIIRIPQAISTILPIGAAIVLLVFIVAGNDIYHWVHYEHQHVAENAPGYDKILDGKSWFLSTKMAYGFLIGIPIVWFLFGKKLRSLSYSEDNASKGDLTFFNKSIRFGAAFTFFFAFSLSILSWVVCMSVDAHWYSTIFSIYNFATAWVSTISIIAMIVLFLRKTGHLKIVTDEHVHDLGKFMFAFSIFWTYLWLAQFLLIWYADIPEEVIYYYKRWEGDFKIHFFINLVLNFIIPFLVLMTRNNKRNPKILTFVAICILAGHWNDIWLMMVPGSIDHQGGIGILEVGMTLAFAGFFIFWVMSALSKKGLVPVNHPYIEESAHHDVGV